MIARRSVLQAFAMIGLGAGAPKAMAQGRDLMTRKAKGSFEVKLAPQAPGAGEEASIGRMLIDKRFHGELEASGRGQMLAIAPDAHGSGVYVAIERVTGVLGGRQGSFALHHTGVMTRGAPELAVTVAPDSGTDELAGLSGKMKIDISDGRHFYEFDYTLPAREEPGRP